MTEFISILPVLVLFGVLYMMTTDAMMDPQVVTVKEQGKGEEKEKETRMVIDLSTHPNDSDPNLPTNIITTQASSSHHPIGVNVTTFPDSQMSQKEPSIDDTPLFQQQTGSMVNPPTEGLISTSVPKSYHRLDPEIKLESPLSQADFEYTLSELVNPDGGLASITLIDSLVSLMSRSLGFLQKCLILNLLGCTAEDRLKLRK